MHKKLQIYFELLYLCQYFWQFENKRIFKILKVSIFNLQCYYAKFYYAFFDYVAQWNQY